MTQPLQWSARILAKRIVAGKVSLTLSNAGGSVRTRAGQYLALAVGEPDSGMLLRRTAWISTSAERGGSGGVIEVVADQSDAGGRWLGRRQRGDLLNTIGPLGRPFSLPRAPMTCLLIGVDSGAGNAALLGLGHELAARENRVEFALAAASESPYGLLDARRIGTATRVVSAGEGPPLSRREVARQIAEYAIAAEPDIVYLAGQATALPEVIEAIDGIGLQRQVAIDAAAVCGTGVCAGCAVPVRGNDSVTRMVRVCTEGPVFNADIVRWQDLQTVPDDCVGGVMGVRSAS